MATTPNHHYDQLNTITRNLMVEAVVRELLTIPGFIPKRFKKKLDKPMPFKRRVALRIEYIIWKIKTAWKVLRHGDCGCGCGEW